MELSVTEFRTRSVCRPTGRARQRERRATRITELRSIAVFRPTTCAEHAVLSLRERLQQRLRILQVSRVKSFGEPVIDWCQEGMGVLGFVLLVPEASKTGSRS